MRTKGPGGSLATHTQNFQFIPRFIQQTQRRSVSDWHSNHSLVLFPKPGLQLHPLWLTYIACYNLNPNLSTQTPKNKLNLLLVKKKKSQKLRFASGHFVLQLTQAYVAYHHQHSHPCWLCSSPNICK